MKEIKCPSCGELIPDDSKFCDMCGVELLECVNCRTLGTDPFCPECGKPMIARRPGATGVDNQVSLVLKARQGSFVLKPENGAVIGRQDSPYAAQLSGLGMISRQHGKFVKRGEDWFIIDLGSTNGTYINNREVPANTPVKISAGDEIDIGTYLFDVVEE